LMIYETGTTALLVQCTFLNNTTGSTIKPAGSDVSMANASTLTLENTLIWGNEPVVIYTTGATVTATNSIAKGVYNSLPWVTEAILFADSSNPTGSDGQWRTPDDGIGLGTCSPAINAGNNSYVPLTTDIADQPRVYTTTVDAGAYEFQQINPVVTPAVNISPGVLPACVGNLVQFSSTNSGAGAPPVYDWQLNGVDVGNTTPSFSSSSLANGDMVSCTVTSTDACDYGQTATSTVNMKVVPAPAISLAATASGACAGSPLSFTASLVGAGTDPGLQWSVNGSISSGSGLTYESSELKNGDILTCTLTPGAGTCSTTQAESNGVTAVVYPLPVVAVTPADTSVLYGTQVTLTGSGSTDITSWQWTPTGSTAPGIEVLAETAEQRYTLTVYTADNCSASAIAEVKVYPPLRMPSGFSPNGDGHNDVFRIPPGTQVNLQQFSIFDRWGNRVFSTQNADVGWDGRVGGQQAPAGTYVYIVVGSNTNGAVNIKGTVVLIR
jgi:gliding motility-associated-like protein